VPPAESRSLVVGEAERKYVVHFPRKYQKGTQTPVLVMLTEQGAQPSAFEGRSDIVGGAAKLGYLLVLPQMLGSEWQHGVCAASGAKGAAKVKKAAAPPNKAGGDAAALADQSSDVVFVTTLLDELRKHYAIDERRVYLVGTDAGAALATQVTRALPGKIAGVAVNVSEPACPAGRWDVATSDGTPPAIVIQQPPRAVVDAAAADPVPQQPDALNAWLELNECTLPASDAGTQDRIDYTCTRAPVVLHTANKATGRWPKKIGRLYTLRVIHTFFEAQTRT
jgi:poly(3-hydroxybutyrate) depolymerase